jgi:hypothetical protein
VHHGRKVGHQFPRVAHGVSLFRAVSLVMHLKACHRKLSTVFPAERIDAQVT